jgi:PhzF family phenazine biosynthesis protein
MQLTIYQIDAFTSRVFGGNPAAVVPLHEWLPDEVLQNIAAENNLSETAFFVPTMDNESDYRLRWFTPAVEVDLCGHATLATAFVIFEYVNPDRADLRFASRSGLLTVKRRGQMLSMDFPSLPGEPSDAYQQLAEALGKRPLDLRAATNYLAVFENETDVRAIKPDMQRVAALEPLGVIITAPGDEPDVDFVSRFFAPAAGIPEDPVTGSAHCTLTPYWAGRLGKRELRARQVSRRGGELLCTQQGDRVQIAGRAVAYMKGRITI